MSVRIGVPTGNFIPNVLQSKTSAYTALVSDLVMANATSAAFTVTLPSNPVVGACVTVQKTDATTNIVTVNPSGSGTIHGDGAGLTTLESQWTGATFQHQGSDVWMIVSTSVGPSGSSLAFVGVLLQTPSAANVATNTAHILSWTVASTDTHGFWSAGAPTRATIPTGQAGYYSVTVGGGYTGVASTRAVQTFAKKNGSFTLGRGWTVGSASGSDPQGTMTEVMYLAAGDYIEGGIDQLDTVTRALRTTTTYMSVVKVAI